MTVGKKYSLVLFFLILISHCVFIYLELNNLRTLTKLLLIPVLMLYLFAQTGGIFNRWVFSGLLLSFLGDLLLTCSGEFFFLLGMGAFIGTHICNSLFFLQLQKGKSGKSNAVFIAVVILAVLSGIVLWTLQPYLGSLQWPILLYMCIINTMAVLATRVFNIKEIKSIAANSLIPGAGLFVLSDAMLAINKFLLHQPMVDIVVMLSYGGAQYFLVMGFSKLGLQKNR